MADKKYRLVTRSDFDGVVCGALLSELGMINDVVFAEPQEMQAGTFSIGNSDITANLPYVESVYLCFDHHVSEAERIGERENFIINPSAPSAARVVYEHFDGAVSLPDISSDLMAAVDKADSAQYLPEEVMAPEGWALLNFITDPRTGLESVKDFSISKDELMLRLITYCRHNPIEEILALPDVVERVDAYKFNSEFGELQVERCATLQDNVVVVDTRGEDRIEMVNRFMVYALHPESTVSLSIRPTKKDGIIEIAAGKSIINRSSRSNLGSMLLEYGGGGHAAAGSCQIAVGKVDGVVADLVKRINAEG